MLNETIAGQNREDLLRLLEIYAKNWLAMDGVWFQSVEREAGMDAAIHHDAEAWRRFTVIEARRIREFLRFGDRPGLEGLAKALPLRLSAAVNENVLTWEDGALILTVRGCRVQDARARKGMPYHPCKPVGEIEYQGFASAIDDRITCQCLSCYPEIEDESCRCKWRFTIAP